MTKPGLSAGVEPGVVRGGHDHHKKIFGHACVTSGPSLATAYQKLDTFDLLVSLQKTCHRLIMILFSCHLCKPGTVYAPHFGLFD